MEKLQKIKMTGKKGIPFLPVIFIFAVSYPQTLIKISRVVFYSFSIQTLIKISRVVFRTKCNLYGRIDTVGHAPTHSPSARGIDLTLLELYCNLEHGPCLEAPL